MTTKMYLRTVYNSGVWQIIRQITENSEDVASCRHDMCAVRPSDKPS